MAIKTKLLPVGIENFKRMRTDDFYYIDKTGFIRDLLENIAYVNLFTRPRRFGKTLNMSMLKYFFEINNDDSKSLFDCKEAMQQIRDRNYDEVLINDGMKTIRQYGIACYKKHCKVLSDHKIII